MLGPKQPPDVYLYGFFGVRNISSPIRKMAFTDVHCASVNAFLESGRKSFSGEKNHRCIPLVFFSGEKLSVPDSKTAFTDAQIGVHMC